MGIILGVLFHFIGGFASGSFYMPYKKVKGWSWESFWIVGGLFSWLIVPPLAAYLTIPGFMDIIKSSSSTVLGYTYLMGLLWGIGGLTYGLGVRYLGVSLGSSIILGLCSSIMFNALKIPQVSKLVQVGIRDYCQAEYDIIKNSNGRVHTFFDRDIKHRQLDGATWTSICNDIIAQLPNEIYLSFDIDGLDPKLCPSTGTPVAGGFEFEQILMLIEKIVDSGKRIISFDINEVAPGGDEWDANVGARLLYRIANMVAKSNGKV